MSCTNGFTYLSYQNFEEMYGMVNIDISCFQVKSLYYVEFHVVCFNKSVISF